MKSLFLIPLLLLGGYSLIFSGYSTHAGPLQDHNGIELTIETDRKIYPQSAPVKITMTVKNTAKDTVTLEFPTSRQFDFIIIKDDREVWLWSRDRYFTQAFTAMIIKPGNLLTYTAEWNQVDNMGKGAGPGVYIVKGVLPTVEGEYSVHRSIIIE